MYHTPSFFQRHPISLVILALAPIAAALSMTTAAYAKNSANAKNTVVADEKVSLSPNGKVDADEPPSSSELSVAPLDHTEYPENRPVWVVEADDMQGETHTRVVVSAPSETLEGSLNSLKLMQAIEIDIYANDLIASDGHPEVFQLNEDWIAENANRFVSKEYAGTLKIGDVEHFEHAVQLRFTPELKDEIRLQWKRVEVAHRLGAISFLIFVGTVLTGCGSAALGIFSRRIERKTNAAETA